MSTFLYFVPRENPVAIQSREQLLAAGLGYADPDDLGGHANKTVSGPGGQSGLLWTQKLPNGEDGPEARYDAATQVWRKNPKSGIWVGYLKDQKPTPETLARKSVRGSGLVQLMDGEDWVVPVCCPNFFNEGATDLPQRYDYDEEGELIATVPDDLKPIADRVFAVYQRFTGEAEWAKGKEARRAEVKADVQLACDLLAMNYRIGPFEAVAVLGLLGSDVYFNVLRASFEADKIEAWGKKKEAEQSAESATSSGETAESPTPTGSATSS